MALLFAHSLSATNAPCEHLNNKIGDSNHLYAAYMPDIGGSVPLRRRRRRAKAKNTAVKKSYYMRER